MKVGILASHPIQYQAPLFRELAEHLDLVVYFAHRQDASGQANAGFGVAFEWDVDLLGGYRSCFLENRAGKPDPSQFFGCNTPEIAKHIADENFDAFIVTGWHLLSYWQAVLACRRFAIPVLVRGDSQLQTSRSVLKRLVKALVYPLLLRLFAGGLYVGKRNRAYLECYGMPSAKLFFAPHCVDNHWFAHQAASADRAVLRREWNIPEQSNVLLFVGKLMSRKRPQDLLNALRLLGLAGVKATALFVGDGPLRSELERQSQVDDVDVRFVGFRNQGELSKFYAMADLMVLPSESSETWGLVVNEALACGLRVVVADAVGCADDLVDSAATGAVYPMGDCSALAHTLKRVLSEPRDLVALSHKINLYSVQASAKGIIAACQAVSA